MLHIIYRCVRPRLRHFVQLFLLIGCFLPLACGDGKDRTEKERPKQERLVSVKLTGGAGVQDVQCGSFQRGGIFGRGRAEEAEDAGKDHYEFLAFDGELLMIQLYRKADKSMDKISFRYIFRGDEKMPLVFSRQPGLALLNDKVICVDLSNKAGAQWFAQQPDAKLKTIRTLLLSGDAATDTAALTRMAGAGITVVFGGSEIKSATSKPTVELKLTIEADVRKALIAAQPACLFAKGMKIDEDVIVQLSDLTHLVISGEKIPDLTKLKKLRFLGLGNVTNLAPLSKLTHLQGLVIADCSYVKDFMALRNLKHLQTLHLGEADGLTDLDFLTDMRELRSLTLGPDTDAKIKNIAPIGKLTNLTELAIVPIPPTVKDLSPLKKLKNLKMLVVDDDGLEKRQEEYDEIRKALPECKIVGFCMGSAWILLVVPVAVGLGVWWRRRSATGKAA